MTTNDLTLDDVKRLAEEIGMTKLTETHLEELLRATVAARKRSAALPASDLTPADEPAHVFRAVGGGES